MLKIDDVLEILSIPLLGIIPDSEEVLKASNLGSPVTLSAPASAPARAYVGRGQAAARRGAADDGALRQRRLPRPAVREAGGMSLFGLFSRRSSAPVARDRLQILLSHERAFVGGNDLAATLQEEILQVIAKHVAIDRDKVRVNLERGESVSTLEIDVEMPGEAEIKQGRLA